MKRHLIAIGLALSLGLGGCAGFAQFVATTATDMSSSTPREVTTYAQATQAATLVTKAATLAVQVGKFDRATLVQLNALNEGVHAAWLSLKADNASGKSLTFGAFNAALDAFRAYATAKGVAQ